MGSLLQSANGIRRDEEYASMITTFFFMVILGDMFMLISSISIKTQYMYK